MDMQARALPKHLGWTSAFLVVLMAACVATSAPRVRACTGDGSAASTGVLRILPSKVPGVEIDSAYWGTNAGAQDLGAWEHLVYYSRLRTLRAVRRSELAIVYEPGSSAMILDADVSSVRNQRDGFGGDERVNAELHARETMTTARVVDIGTTFRVGKWSAIRYCPSAVQLIARSEVPFLLMPRLASDSVRLDAAQNAASRRSPLVVVKDTVVRAGWDGRSRIALAAVNVGDTTLTDMIIALVVVGPALIGDTSMHGAVPAVEDTIEYHIGPVAARGRVGFVGGELRYRENIVERISYSASAVTGRAIAPVGRVRRVSQTRTMGR